MESLPFQYQKKPYWEFICPVCKKERRTFYWPSPRRRHYAQLTAAVVALTAAVWPFVGLKGAFLFFPAWALMELIYRARARQSVICPYCNFDPYLYKHDVELARKKVEEHFAAKKRAIEERKRAKSASSYPEA